MNGHVAAAGDLVNAAVLHNHGMGSHSATLMHYALEESKCLLHQPIHYLGAMDQVEIGKRLAKARERAGYPSASAAAEAMGIPVATYVQHENGTRGFRFDRAERYARKFKTTPEWILYGTGEERAPEPTEAELEAMIRTALDGAVTLDTKISDLPRIVAPALHEQLERFQADRSGSVADFHFEASERERSSRSRAPTRRDAKAESRSS